MDILDWKTDESTIDFIKLHEHKWNLDFKYSAEQFDGEKFSSESLSLYIDDVEWMKIFARSRPKNIIRCFENDKILEGLALVVLWGGMSRTKNRIYARDKSVIRKTLVEAREIILRTNEIDGAWNLLQNELEWTNVMISKTLHFMTRASGFDKNPPVPIDGAVILKTVWPFLTRNIAEAPKGWSNGLPGYRRYMTFMNYFASKLGWTTTQFENTLFHHFG